MLNDLPVDMEVLEELNISCLDPMLKDYVFSSFFLARLLDKTLKEKNELAKENESLKAKIGDYDNLKRTFEELKKTLDAMSDVPQHEQQARMVPLYVFRVYATVPFPSQRGQSIVPASLRLALCSC